MNKKVSFAVGLTAIGALILCVSFSYARGRLEEAAYQRAKACNDAYWNCMGHAQNGGWLQDALEKACLTKLQECRQKANLPRTTDGDTPPQIHPATSATPPRRFDGSKMGVTGVTASATPTRRTQGLDAHTTSATPTKSSPTPSPKPKPTATVSKKSSN